MANFSFAFDKTMDNEGGDKYTETLGDSGGPTKYGISLKMYRNITMPGYETKLYYNATYKDIQDMTLERAKEIYKMCFWDANKYGDIENQRVADKVFDMCVLFGAKVSNTALQSSLLMDKNNVDGIIGKKTLSLLNSWKDTEGLLESIKQILCKKVLEIVNKNESQMKFVPGWLRRIRS